MDRTFTKSASTDFESLNTFSVFGDTVCFILFHVFLDDLL